MMAGFTEVALSKKLAELNSSQQSIQTLSLWLIHHRKHHATIVKVWFRELQKAKENRKLTFMYLANDVIQNSKKKGPEFGKEFGIVLKRAFEHMEVAENDDKTRNSLGRILNIWEERGVYDSKTIKEFKKSLEINIVDPSAKRKRKSEETVEKAVKTIRSSIKTETEVKQDGTKEVHIRLSPQAPPRDPPEPEELVKILSDLENSASSDAAIRERIAKLPPEVVNASLLAKLQDYTGCPQLDEQKLTKSEAQRLGVQVDDAVALVSDYNARLSQEIEDRKKLMIMLQDFVDGQRELLVHAEKRLEEYSDKLNKVYVVRQELKSHLENLPDLTALPDVTGGGLAPLPSAGDLFSMH